MTPGHWIIAPVVIPLLTGLLLLVEIRRPLWQRRLAGVTSTVLLMTVSVGLLTTTADGSIHSYALGAWPAPFGIVLVLDRLAATMLAMTAVLALAAILHAIRGVDRQGANFHPLFQLQLAGLNGAFLTGDLFNLFVFFEVLLLASYTLLLHSHGAERTRSGLHYMVLNLTGSSLFLVGLGLVYGATGTLNMADLARRVDDGQVTDPLLLTSAGLVLLVVFALKAAVLPLNFWLPRAYAAATAPVAALFAVMTKVGIYAILRLWPLLFGQGDLGAAVPTGLLWLGLMTLAVATLGVFSADRLGSLVAWTVVVSIGTLVVAISQGTGAAWAGALYYMIHTTWLTGALFLLVGVIGRQRGTQADLLQSGPALRHPMLLGAMLLIAAMAVAGVPPLSGFVGKLALLQALPAADFGLFWALLLVSGLAALVSFTRAGSTVFWRPAGPAQPDAVADPVQIAAIVFLVTAGLALALAAEPVLAWATATAEQLLTPELYQRAVLGPEEVAR